VLFFIDTSDAEKAFFSPDSHSVIFYTLGLRIEVWDIATRHRTSLHEMTLNQDCWQTKLSPDAAYLACLREDFSLALLDVATGQAIVEKKSFVEIYNYWFSSSCWRRRASTTRTSPIWNSRRMATILWPARDKANSLTICN